VCWQRRLDTPQQQVSGEFPVAAASERGQRVRHDDASEFCYAFPWYTPSAVCLDILLISHRAGELRGAPLLLVRGSSASVFHFPKYVCTAVGGAEHRILRVSQLAVLHTILPEQHTLIPCYLSRCGSLLYICALFENLLASVSPRLVLHLINLGVYPLDVALPWIHLGFVGLLEVEQVCYASAFR
jgi:hypothetical protein